jgi:hypothetical protein
MNCSAPIFALAAWKAHSFCAKPGFTGKLSLKIWGDLALFLWLDYRGRIT